MLRFMIHHSITLMLTLMPTRILRLTVAGQSIAAAAPRFVTLAGLLLVAAVTLVAQQPDHRDATEADVIVYGATPGGFCAAIAAAREGASVILLEPTDHIGAMNTGGLSHCDSNQMVRSTVMGLFHEWHTRIVKDYTDRGLAPPYDPANKDQSRWTFEPHVAMRVTMHMLEEAGVRVLTGRYLQSVNKDGPRISSLVSKNGTFAARVFVDGTYEGDLLAAAGVDWTIGREGRGEYGESLAGKQYPKQKMNINGFDDQGNLLPLVTSAEGGPEDAGDSNIMTYSFRLCLTAVPENRVPMPEPDNYDSARFEIVRRALQAGEKRIGFDLYPLPGDKFDGNNSIGGQFSIGLVGGATGWHSADEAGRKQIWEAHKQYTLELYHFLTTDVAVPAAIRNQYAELGLCRDEFTSYDHFSPALYVRESRRMQGQYVIGQQDILTTPEKDDPIAVSSFPIDSHDCQRIALNDGGVINEGTIFPVRRENPKQGYAYHIPYRAILPKTEQCNNLLVPVALSCTHVGISSLRIEGTWMVIGQAAGIAAALASDQNVAVQKLRYATLRERLLAQNQVLELPDLSQPPSATGSIAPKSRAGIVLDEADAELGGNWSQSTNFKPYIAKGYVFSGEPDSHAKGDGSASPTAVGEDPLAIWPEFAPGESTKKSGTLQAFRPEENPRVSRVVDISYPTMTVHLSQQPNGTAVLILPGGGFGKVVPDKEGTEAADWLNGLGISVFVLSYRTQSPGDEEGWRKPLQDAQRALSMIRSNATQWQLSSNKLGVIGFSAGGQVAARLLSDERRAYAAIDEVDALSSRPDFALLIYPWNIYDESKHTLVDGVFVHQDFPTTFLVHTDDDRSSSLGAVLIYAGLKKLGIGSELHVYGNGGHGYGMRPVEGSQISTWPQHATHWLRMNQFAEHDRNNSLNR